MFNLHLFRKLSDSSKALASSRELRHIVLTAITVPGLSSGRHALRETVYITAKSPADAAPCREQLTEAVDRAKRRDPDLDVPLRGRDQFLAAATALDRAGRGQLPRLRSDPGGQPRLDSTRSVAAEDLTNRRPERAIDLAKPMGEFGSSGIALGHRVPPRPVEDSRITRSLSALQASSSQALVDH